MKHPHSTNSLAFYAKLILNRLATERALRETTEREIERNNERDDAGEKQRNERQSNLVGVIRDEPREWIGKVPGGQEGVGCVLRGRLLTQGRNVMPQTPLYDHQS